jgi:hypothetical protein
MTVLFALIPVLLAAIQTVFTVMAYYRQGGAMPDIPSAAIAGTRPKIFLVLITILTWIVISYYYYSLYEPQILIFFRGTELEQVIK